MRVFSTSPALMRVGLSCYQVVSSSRKAGILVSHSPLPYRYTENRSSFASLAQQSAQLSQSPSALYEVPSSRKAYSFRFAPTQPEQINKVLETLSIQTASGHSS